MAEYIAKNDYDCCNVCKNKKQYNDMMSIDENKERGEKTQNQQ